MKWKWRRLSNLGSVSAVVHAETAAVYEVLTDYNNYLEWFPMANHSKLMVKEGDLAIAEFGFDRPPNTRLTVECIHTKNEMVLHRRISGNFPMIRMQWNMQEEGADTRVTLRTEMDLRNWRILYPGAAQNFVDSALLDALQGRVSAFSSDFQDAGGRKFLEVVQTEDCLEVWLLGKRYKLVPMEEAK
ncbi:MAG: SRPBCC family protein [Bryobacteraceae bacterium]